jgi:hypothetical protein
MPRWKPRSEKLANLSPWVLILLTAPLPLFLLGYVGYQWRTKTTKLGIIEEQFLERQNSVLAHDAGYVAERVSELLSHAAVDVKTLALTPPSVRKNFLELQQFAILGAAGQSAGAEPPMGAAKLRYNRSLVMRVADQNIEWYWEADSRAAPIKSLSECITGKLCDRALLDSSLKLREGEVLYGKALRIYTPKGVTPNDNRAGLSVAYRQAGKIYFLTVDYRHFWALLSSSTFPYANKRDWLRSYGEGNYLYLVDRSADMLIHPKSWHVAGVDEATGQPVAPMKEDADEGMRPLNLLGYKTGILRPYFDRLLNESFPRNSVDIFEAKNLGGTSRVLSVVPVFLSEGQFLKTGLFGHLIVGCALDYFREPKEKRQPYY